MSIRKAVYKDKVRDVLVINKPSDNYFALDLSEYSIAEQEFYAEGVKELHDEYIAKLKDLGVSSNYRYFNKDKIDWVDDETA